MQDNKLVFISFHLVLVERYFILSHMKRDWVYVCLDTCCSHFLTIIAGVDLHFRHESELPGMPDWAEQRCQFIALSPIISRSCFPTHCRGMGTSHAHCITHPARVLCSSSWERTILLHGCTFHHHSIILSFLARTYHQFGVKRVQVITVLSMYIDRPFCVQANELHT